MMGLTGDGLFFVLPVFLLLFTPRSRDLSDRDGVVHVFYLFLRHLGLIFDKLFCLYHIFLLDCYILGVQQLHVNWIQRVFQTVVDFT